MLRRLRRLRLRLLGLHLAGRRLGRQRGTTRATCLCLSWGSAGGRRPNAHGRALVRGAGCVPGPGRTMGRVVCLWLCIACERACVRHEVACLSVIVLVAHVHVLSGSACLLSSYQSGSSRNSVVHDCAVRVLDPLQVCSSVTGLPHRRSTTDSPYLTSAPWVAVRVWRSRRRWSRRPWTR